MLILALLFTGACSNHHSFYIVFDDVTGLPLNSPVIVKDHSVGSVTKVELGTRLEPVVTIKLDDPYRFSMDSRFVIKEGADSPPLVHVVPGTSQEMIGTGDTVHGINLIRHHKDSVINSINRMVDQYEHTLNERDSIQRTLEHSREGLPEPTPEHLE